MSKSKYFKLACQFAALSLALPLATAYAADTTGITADTIKIGVPGAFTGFNAPFGAVEHGISAYYHSINAKGGIHGRKLEPIEIDTACNEAQGISAFKKLIFDDKVFFINGIGCSGVGLAVKPLVLTNKTPFLVAQAVNPDISSPVTPYVFHTVPTSVDAGNTQVDFAMSAPEPHRIAVISFNDEWGKSYHDPEVAYLEKKYNTKPVVDLTMARGATTAVPQLLKIKEANATFIIANLYAVETAIMLREMHDLGINIPVIGGFATNIVDLLARVQSLDIMRPYCGLDAMIAPIGSPALEPWNKIFQATYPKESITTYTYLGMGGAVAAVKAMEAAGPELTREKFIAELEKLRDFDTGILAGKITFTPEDHQGVKQSAVACYDDAGNAVFYASWQKPLAAK
ncbi:ABC transporter substrate-binding protein [Castellaniella sp. GW247-6E4]|uniref:ABC transporter substrate-binding protein n=1 Tax=Castellaniella sp. GW247-6E4 TaxID=3140380 RepID=UPI003315E650